MSFRRSTRGSRRISGQLGYTVVELLVAMMLSAVVMSMAVSDFGFTVHMRRDLDLLVETQHGLRSALAEITQELRQAGACLPTTGDFISLGGKNDGEHDRLTVRIGKVDDDVVCIRTVVVETAVAGTSTLVVQDSSRFEPDEWVYLRSATGTGQTARVASVTSSALVIDGSLDVDYTDGSGVFAIEERAYGIDASSAYPMLTVAIDGEDPQPLVGGVEKLDVEYLLTPCPPCDPVAEPADGDQWHQVREVAVRVGVISSVPNHQGDYVRLTGTTNIKPRNLL
jgi:type II secretory pathway pseudopilin PulG